MFITDEQTWHPANRPAADSFDPRQANRLTTAICEVFLVLALTARWAWSGARLEPSNLKDNFSTAASLAISLHSSHSVSHFLVADVIKIGGMFRTRGRFVIRCGQILASPASVRASTSVERTASGRPFHPQ